MSDQKRTGGAESGIKTKAGNSGKYSVGQRNFKCIGYERRKIFENIRSGT